MTKSEKTITKHILEDLLLGEEECKGMDENGRCSIHQWHDENGRECPYFRARLFLNQLNEETYCIYCGKTANQIRRENYQAGERLPCKWRGTPRGFHSYAIGEL